jgi:hypothetical protein
MSKQLNISSFLLLTVAFYLFACSFQLVVGTPFYGRTYTLGDPKSTDLGAWVLILFIFVEEIKFIWAKYLYELNKYK